MPKMDITLAESVQGIGAAGDRVSLSLTEADVHDPVELADYLAGYKPFGYRADEASPVVGVDNTTFKYRTFSQNDAFLPVKVKGSPNGAVPEVDPSSTLSEGATEERYIGSFIPARTQNTSTSYNPRMAAGRRCMRAVQLDREIDVFTLLGTSTNWAAAQRNTATGTGWGDLTNGNPILDLHAMLEDSDQPVSEIWMNQKIAHRFLRHDKVREHMRQFFGDGATGNIASAVAAAGKEGSMADFMIPGMPPIKVTAAKYETGSGLSYVMPDVCFGVTTPPAGIPNDGEEIATSWTFRYRGLAGVGINVREFFVDGRGPEGGTMVVVHVSDKAIMTANNAGGIITGV